MDYIRVKVAAASKHTSVSETKSGVLSVSTREPAEDNRANTAVLKIVADFYNIPINTLVIVSGHKKPSKLLKVLTKPI